jgi:hypothetical protein
MPFSGSCADPNVTSTSFFFRFWISTTCYKDVSFLFLVIACHRQVAGAHLFE